MKNEDIAWFKAQFHKEINDAVEGTPFSLDMLTAIACQETGYIWSVLRKTDLSTARILGLCVGDTLDSDKGRRAFPLNKTDLLSKPNGQQMFDIARKGLVDMSQFIPGFGFVKSKPNKFCHGFGIFQYDLQFFLDDPNYFLEQRYIDINNSIAKCLEELQRAVKKIGFQDKSTLTDFEMACVAIAYNTGRFRPGKGLKQGFFNGTKFYGEEFFDFLRQSQTIPVDDIADAPLPAPQPGNAPLPPPTPITASGTLFQVDSSNGLRLRNQPTTDGSIIKATLPDSQIVQAVSDKKTNGFIEVETSLLGAHLTGFVFAQFLKPAPNVTEVPVLAPTAAPVNSNIREVTLVRKGGGLTKRTDPANAFSLNEANQPARKGTTPDELRTELAAIIDWLAVDKAKNLRYQPGNGSTFCNIYAHDYCFLAGVYLPRVWWTQSAIELLAMGQDVQPQFEKTIDEQRANDLSRWLRDFGLRFGWRQTGTLSKLQQEVNQGAVGLIVARQKNDGRSGHIVMVVPETNDFTAKRNAMGEVTSPLQSQAGTTNFSYGTGRANWWQDEKFADSSFWLHA